MSVRWAPPLPTLGGRAGPRSIVELGSTFVSRLETYFQEHSSCASLFERGVDLKFYRSLRCKGYIESPFREGLGKTKRLGEFSPGIQYQILLQGSYIRFSRVFRKRMKDLLYKRKLNTVKQWFYTADAVVMPYLLTCEEPSTEVADRLAKFALESCANNYSHFLKSLKTVKKSIRKCLATTNERPVILRSMRTYTNVLYSLPFMSERCAPDLVGRNVLTWTQTRASGLADGKMIRASLKKLEETVTVPVERVIQLNPSVLHDTVKGFWKVSGNRAKISIGSSACLEYTRERGGKTSMFKSLCSHKVLTRSFDPVDLSMEVFPARNCRSSHDVLSWAVDWVLKNPVLRRVRRTHAVAEPSKARTIGVPPYAVTVIFGICAHIVAPTLTSQGVKSGLKSSRHLWNFLRDNLSPQNNLWEHLSNGKVFALSTDEETATDFGDLHVSDQIWGAFLQIGRKIDGFPLGLFQLARKLFREPRIFLFSAGNNNLRYVVSTRSWPMGDMFTKVILTIVNDYGCRLSGLRVYSLVGDDIIALSNLKNQLEYLLTTLKDCGMKISEDDTFVSSYLMFYCEEGSLVPQRVQHTPRIQMRRGKALFYLDYPRIRLMIPTESETDSYSLHNIGRMALLGKESQWVAKCNPRASDIFVRASLIQHIVVPADKDVLCPYTPMEIGGDGAFPQSGEFLKNVVEKKSRGLGLDEVRFRMSSLMTNKFRHKLVRTDKMGGSIHKHHLYLDKVEDLRGILPEAVLVIPQNESQRIMLNSVSFPNLEKPSQTFVRLCKEAYYRAIFRGQTPPEPTFDLSRHFGPRGTKVILSYERFRSTWMDPGFIFRDVEPYMVDKDLLIPELCTGLGWYFRRRDHIPQSENWESWVRSNLSIRDQSMDDLVRAISSSVLPRQVADRLSEYFESDVYVKSQIDVDYSGCWVIITKDIRLCMEIHNMVNPTNATDDVSTYHIVYAVDPILYLVGRLEEAVGLPESDFKVVEDAGSILHTDFTEFENGSPLTVSEDDLFIGEIISEDSRFSPWVQRKFLRRTIY